MKMRMAALVGAVLGSAGLAACGDEGLGGALILIQDGWREVGGNRVFILDPAPGTSDGGRTGVFVGEVLPVDDSVFGNWRDGRVELRFQSNLGELWRARVQHDAPDTLRFERVGSAGADSLVITTTDE